MCAADGQSVSVKLPGAALPKSQCWLPITAGDPSTISLLVQAEPASRTLPLNTLPHEAHGVV